jgi:hypothetical protein
MKDQIAPPLSLSLFLEKFELFQLFVLSNDFLWASHNFYYLLFLTRIGYEAERIKILTQNGQNDISLTRKDTSNEKNCEKWNDVFLGQKRCYNFNWIVRVVYNFVIL